ncbi:hypothetical protein M8C21_032503 [Ambrosia artemisiifolia]|uniref:Protein NRT1/ PTR FAMILY 5.5-like n=1 Tax=Ambrosia artemisiifolia TaxID=4212 RepID=A0AAD5BSG3_AMBAR|nr:hypothetical protein M8C21_032503 [Ambrosia artemisiifolia]
MTVIHNASIVQKYALMFMIIYLTDVWGLGITHAAGLINIWFGMTKILALVFRVLMDYCIGSYSMLVISSTANALGMGLLSISTPSRLYSLITGSCREYNMKCISETQQSLFYLALVLIMIGRSACAAAMETLNFIGNADEKELRQQFVKSGSGYAAVQATLLVLTPWSVIFAVASFYNSIAVSLLMEKSWSHKLYISNPERSPVKSVVRVFVTSKKRPREMKISDKEFEDAQVLVRMLLVGVIYAFFVLISTICTTYFYQQAKRLKPSIFFRFEFIEVSYLAWYFFYEEIRIKFKSDNRYGNKVDLRALVMGATINAITCCAIAAVVERTRLGVIRKYGVGDIPGEIIPMSRFWLLPQFGMLGYFNTNLDPIRRVLFFEDASLPMQNFKEFVFNGLIGVGVMSSVLVVYLVGKISEMGGRPNWFQHDTENSRLDLFYWALIVLCILFFNIWFHGSNYLNKRLYPRSRPLGEQKIRRR